MINIQNLNQYYGGSHTLHNINLSTVTAKCTCIIGRNGVGKTTLLKAIMGEVKITADIMEFNNNDLLKTNAAKRAYLGIGYVPQGRQIFPLLTVEENIIIGLPVRKKVLGRNENKVPDMIYDLFPILFDMKRRRGGDLSGGQQQQLAIARALVINPSLLILDEPTEGIQPNIVQDIISVINKLKKELNMTILVVEQKLGIIQKLADYFVLLDRGSNVSSGNIEELTPNLIEKYLHV